MEGSREFTVGLVQMSMTTDPKENLARVEEAARGRVGHRSPNFDFWLDRGGEAPSGGNDAGMDLCLPELIGETSEGSRRC